GYEARLVRGFGGLFVADPPGEAGTFVVQLVGQVFHAVVGLGYAGRVEGVGFDDVGAGVEIGPFDAGNDLGPAENQQCVVAFEIPVPVDAALAAECRFAQLEDLDHGAHAAVESQNALAQGVV